MIHTVKNYITILKYFQEIDLKVHCVKGVGKDHAKFSPVGMYVNLGCQIVSPYTYSVWWYSGNLCAVLAESLCIL